MSDKYLTGRDYWRSLDELEDSKAFIDWVGDEFPDNAEEMVSPVSRRSFLTLMGASFALAGLTGCIRRPEENILPYSKAPESVLPGMPSWYATTFRHPLGGYGTGLLVESHEGRPTKIEGNPEHPDSLGATDSYTQASVLDLYDPDRLTEYKKDGQRVESAAFLTAVKGKAGELKGKQGAGLRFLSEADASPTLQALREKIAQTYPQAVWHTYEPVSLDNARDGAQLAFGQPVQPLYNLENASVVLSLDSDFLLLESGSVRYTRQFATRRRADTPVDDLNRLYVVENIFTVTGGKADHRLRLRSSQIEAFAKALAVELGAKGVTLPPEVASALGAGSNAKFDVKWLSALATDLKNNAGKSVILVGRQQPATVHALAHVLNAALGNVGKTVTFVRPASVEATPANVDTSLAGLVAAMKQKQVDTLVILGGNPVYNTPADLEFGGQLKGVGTTIHLTLNPNETSVQSHWQVPRTHYLEHWSDARAIDGTASVVQPLIEPLYAGLSDLELVSYFLELPSNKGYDLVRGQWQGQSAGGDFEKHWRRSLHDGLVAGSALARVEVQPATAAIATALAARKLDAAEASASNLEIVFTPDSKVFDGRFNNNGWLQELPETMTKLTWDNAALMSPKTARELGVKNQEMIALNYKGRSIKMPVWVMPGYADYSVVVPLGYGRTVVGRVGANSGFNGYLLRDSSALNFDLGLTIAKTGDAPFLLATTQEHGKMEGRPIVREGTVSGFKKDPKFAQKMVEHPPLDSLFTEHVYEGQQWGLTVDLNACTGCNACVVACQSENNIPIVGKKRVLNGREMHWMRMDRYFTGDEENPESVQQPLLCQQCQNAPCESVCPVAATSHSKDGGLNDMVYNRCIGTRYCSNNCPFKVRRFNFFNYHEEFTEVEKMQQNPDVTVRMRGVMEKCTYCVQRIHRARRDAKIAGKLHIEDGAIVTACAQVCPAQAIVFGDINDPNTRVSKLKEKDLNYRLLEELNIKPRTSYLARLRNPNPELG